MIRGCVHLCMHGCVSFYYSILCEQCTAAAFERIRVHFELWVVDVAALRGRLPSCSPAATLALRSGSHQRGWDTERRCMQRMNKIHGTKVHFCRPIKLTCRLSCLIESYGTMLSPSVKSHLPPAWVSSNTSAPRVGSERACKLVAEVIHSRPK